MKFHTFCIVAGSLACNARCSWCVAGMTPKTGVPDSKLPPINKRVFDRACRIAEINGLDTARITGKGEPTIFPDQITEYLTLLKDYRFPFIELQTNGILIAEGKVTDKQLKTWYDLGMTHICISVVSYKAERNRLNYTPHKKEYIDLPALIAKLHQVGFNVRLTCIMQRGDIDCAAELEKFMAFARENKVEQVTALPVNKPENSRDGALYENALKALLTEEQLRDIRAFAERGTKLQTLPWGGRIYDINGQNLCLSYCLTVSPDADESRQVIFLPPGQITYDWQYEGAILFREPEAARTQLVQLTKKS